MPADFSALFDTLLVLAGLVLVATGLVMFVYSKTSTQASSVEAFGIKLNVTHPSLILVLAGVGLMLAPRLLPGLPGKSDKPEAAVVADAAKPQAAASTQSTSPETAVAPAAPPAPAPAVHPSPAPSPSTPTAVAPAAAAKATVTPAVAPPSAAPVQPTHATKPRIIAAPVAAPKKSAPQLAYARPAATPTAPAHPEAAVTPSVTPPTTAAKPARPTLAFSALGLPISRDFWSGETRASYTRRMHTTLQQSGREVLRMDTRGLELGQTEFDAWWNESGQHPRSRELCSAPQAPRALLSARVETPTTISSVESAYWPELRLRLFDCANQRQYRQQRTLSPQKDDAWPFATDLNVEIERFLRTYRTDLTD